MAPTTFVLVTLAWQFGSGVAEAQHGGCEAREPSQSCMTATLAHDVPHDDAAQMKTSLLQNGLHQDRDEIGVHEQEVGKIRNKEAHEAEWAWAKNKFNNMKDKVKDKFDDVKDKVNDWKDKVTDVKETVKDGIGQAKDIWSELRDNWVKLKGIVKKEKDKIDDLVELDGIFEAHLVTALDAIQRKASLLQDGEVGNAQNTEAQEAEWGWVKSKFNDAKKLWKKVKGKVDDVKDVAKTLMEHKEAFGAVIDAASGLAR